MKPTFPNPQRLRICPNKKRAAHSLARSGGSPLNPYAELNARRTED